MKNRWWMTGSVLVMLAAPLRAQPSGNGFEISPLVGHLFGGRVEEVFSPPGEIVFSDTRFDVGDDVSYGIRLGYNLPSGLEPEIQWLRLETNLLRSTISPPFPPPLEHRVPIFPITVNYYLTGLTYNFTQSRLRPYASLGLGAATLSAPTGTEVRFTGEAAVGLKAFVTPWLALRVEARGYASRLGDSPLGICGSGTFVPAECQAKSWLVNSDIGGGLVFAF